MSKDVKKEDPPKPNPLDMYFNLPKYIRESEEYKKKVKSKEVKQ